MPDRSIDTLVIHCSASRNGVSLAAISASNGGPHSAAALIDTWHANRGFQRQPHDRESFNPQLAHIGYHYVIDTDGTLETGRHRNEVGAHVQGHNQHSIGVCMVGTDAFRDEQWKTLDATIGSLLKLYGDAQVCGHRDLSPDLNHDGRITPNEFTKVCPGFDVGEWYTNGLENLRAHRISTP